MAKEIGCPECGAAGPIHLQSTLETSYLLVTDMDRVLTTPILQTLTAIVVCKACNTAWSLDNEADLQKFARES